MTLYETVTALCEQNLRPILYWRAADGTETLRGAPGLTPVFDPPLSAAELATYGDLETMARFGVTLTLAEWQGIKADAAGLKSYLGVASPTAAQTAAATKAIIRVLATIIRS